MVNEANMLGWNEAEQPNGVAGKPARRAARARNGKDHEREDVSETTDVAAANGTMSRLASWASPLVREVAGGLGRLGVAAGGIGTPANVGGRERLASVALGAPLLAMAARNKSALRLAVGAMGAEMVYRGLTGHCPVYRAVGVDTAKGGNGHGDQVSVPYGQGIRVEESIAVDRPRTEVYAFWRQLENLPRIMRHLTSVTEVDGTRSHWVANAPAGTKVAWDAEIINEEPNARIGWRSLPDADVANAGSVQFADTADGQGTVVKVEMAYKPPAGPLGAAVAKMFGEEPSQQVRGDLKRFKEVMESGEAVAEGVR